MTAATAPLTRVLAPTESYDFPEWVDSMFVGILRQFERVFWNVNQREHDGEAATLGRIYYRPFCWGDCDCGYEQRRAESEPIWLSQHKHDDDCAGTQAGCGCSHGTLWREYVASDGHLTSCQIVLPNFGIEGDHVQIEWYKHPGRINKVNVQMSADEWICWHDRVLDELSGVEHHRDLARTGYCMNCRCWRCGKVPPPDAARRTI